MIKYEYGIYILVNMDFFSHQWDAEHSFFPHKNPELLEDFHKVFGLERQAMINVCVETATRTVFGSRQDRHMWVIDQIRRGS